MRIPRKRLIRLSIIGKSIIPQLFGIYVPPRTTFDKFLKYNFPLIESLYAKTFRKTWESLLLFSYPQHSLEIALSQGYDQLTELRYYANLPFLEEDLKSMKQFVEGWI